MTCHPQALLPTVLGKLSAPLFWGSSAGFQLRSIPGDGRNTQSGAEVLLGRVKQLCDHPGSVPGSGGLKRNFTPAPLHFQTVPNPQSPGKNEPHTTQGRGETHCILCSTAPGTSSSLKLNTTTFKKKKLLVKITKLITSSLPKH